ncbi:MAG: hypothetical protein KDK91_27095, partial [Gammaproteobacteria bacterium]|nr:hypothetical protein [Gammaproteobacteria bacterium]
AYLIVRAEISEAALREPFDRWYREEHLPDAHRAFKANAAWRGWSSVDPKVHYAFYEFDDLDRVKAITGSAEIEALIAEFDRTWEGRVTRTRDVVEQLQSI